MSHNITVEGGKSVRLPTKGKYCDRDIVVTAEGGAEDLDAVLTEQEELIATLQDTLRGKAAGGEPVIEPLVVSENGTYTAPDGVDGYSPVTVNVPIPDGYIQPSGSLEITENGEYDITDKASVAVAVEAGGGGHEIIDGLIQGDLTEIVNNSVTLIRQWCFGSGSFWKLLNYARFDNALTIEANAFNNCRFLKTVDLGSVTSITANAFYLNSSLNALIIRTSTVCTLSGAFTNNSIASGTGYVYVPAALVDSYKAATNWVNYASQFRTIEDYPEICGGEG